MEIKRLVFHFNIEELKSLENDLNQVNVDELNKLEKENLRSKLLDILGNGFWMPALLGKYKSQNKLSETLKKIIPRIISDIIKPQIIKIKKDNERIELNQKRYRESLERNKIASFVYKNKEDFYTNDREFYCLIGVIESGQVDLTNLKEYCLNENLEIPMTL